MGHCFLLYFDLLTNHVPDSHLLYVHADDSQAGARRIAGTIIHDDSSPDASVWLLPAFLLGKLSSSPFYDLCPCWYKIQVISEENTKNIQTCG